MELSFIFYVRIIALRRGFSFHQTASGVQDTVQVKNPSLVNWWLQSGPVAELIIFWEWNIGLNVLPFITEQKGCSIAKASESRVVLDLGFLFKPFFSPINGISLEFYHQFVVSFFPASLPSSLLPYPLSLALSFLIASFLNLFFQFISEKLIYVHIYKFIWSNDI